MRSLIALALAIPTLAFAQVKKQPGLAVTYAAAGKTDTTTLRLAALYVPKGSPASPFVPAGPFTAKITGDIDSQLRSEYTFAVEVRGQVKVSINGTPILDAAGAAAAQYADKTVQLNKGGNAVVIEFLSDGEEDAQFRLDWWNKEFPREPVPPSAWTHTPGDAKGAVLREGRMLFATRHCASCHSADLPKDGTGMPELLATAPDLVDSAARFKPEWLAAWIENPRSVRPGATMPHLPLSKEQANDIAAYLATLGKPAEAKVDAEKAPPGGGMFATFACIACHTTPDFAGKDAHSRIPLAHVKGKYHPAALTEFLKLPATHAPFTAMPNFRLTDEEAAALTAYLLDTAKTEFPPTKGDEARGKALVTSAGCANCHTIPGVEKSTLAAPALTAIKSGGCLSEKPAKAPDFGFAATQREALTSFLKDGLDSLKRDTSADYAERQIRTLNCTACHARDGQMSVYQQIEEELGPFAENAPKAEAHIENIHTGPGMVPQMTWFGEKLETGYMSGVIAGAMAFKPRPWMATRMPGFGGPGGGISFGLAQQHGFPTMDAPEPAPDKARAAIGEKLLGADGGFNCASCHAVKDGAATAVFEAPGPNLAYTAQRIRKYYYTRWLLNPPRVEPETKMTKFSEDGETTQLTEVLDGKARDQVDAIWQYLQSIK